MDVFTNQNEARLPTIWRLIAFMVITILALLPFFIISAELKLPDIYLALLWKVIIIGTIIFAALKIDKRSLTSLGLAIDKKRMLEVAAGTLIAALAMAFIFLLLLGFGWIELMNYGWSKSGFYTGFLVFLFHMILVGIWEEMAFRGYFIINVAEGLKSKTISKNMACFAAVAITAFLFGFVHFNNPNADWAPTINIMLAGVVLSVPFIITGQLALSIGLHFGWNFFQGGIFGFEVSGLRVDDSLFIIRETGPDAWTGGPFGPEAGISGTLGLAFLIILVIIYVRKADYNMSVNIALKNTKKDTG